MLNTFRIIATSVFGIFTFIVGSFLSANIRKLASDRGWDNLLVHGWDKLPQKWRDELRWDRLQRLWWLWFIFGGSGGAALALWLTPFPPKSTFLALEDGQKWRFSESLRDAAVAENGERISCEFALGLSRPLQQFVRGLWTELQPMLDLSGWRHTASGDLGLGQHQFPAGFTILAGAEKGQPLFVRLR
jgi:hypothetical protein